MIDGADAVRQSLATGTPGVALLHLERAMNGTGSWSEAHAHIRQTATGPVDGGVHAGLYYGTPAIAFLLHPAAAADERYQAAAATLDQHILRLTRRRLTAATDRMRHGDTATLGEYDLFYGLTGIGALLLHRMPGSDTFADLLQYLSRLTQRGRLSPLANMSVNKHMARPCPFAMHPDGLQCRPVPKRALRYGTACKCRWPPMAAA
ncbi:lanthionine synthetase LanC family protein [Dactylosporangium sp. AC04546]|uniref:lanthionine synthetase LanC family protein n=1 Tax=Dactylosporangium sp. AC04546 TaxID=2862460 RepID=UPI001EDE260C|nr:lanthionine synthetase LanC family protein [Dactylosporangium sp. AC04546]WVK89567.1 lanthionine synthetase LanC family protein [Dactylosporangium sp. AC04546]